MKKMSTWFKLPVCCMPSEIGGWMEHVNFGVKGLSSHHCEAIEDAINHHDRLTEENAKLREALSAMVIHYDRYNANLENISKLNDIASSAKQLLNQPKEQGE